MPVYKVCFGVIYIVGVTSTKEKIILKWTKGGLFKMVKDFLWETFKRTGDIEAYMGYKEIKETGDSEAAEKHATEEVISVR